MIGSLQFLVLAENKDYQNQNDKKADSNKHDYPSLHIYLSAQLPDNGTILLFLIFHKLILHLIIFLLIDRIGKRNIKNAVMTCQTTILFQTIKFRQQFIALDLL